MSNRKEDAKELRRQAESKSRESKNQHWHPTEGKQAADDEDELFNAAREKQWGNDGEEEDDS